MHAFSYQQPTSILDACSILRSDPESKLIAGGQTLLPSMRLRLIRPTQLVDLSGINELRGITDSAGALTVGAMTRHCEVASSPAVRARIPALAELASLIGDRMVRNMGTLGGSVANSDPAADYPAALVALNAVITTNARSIPAEDFFKGLFETALAPDELVVRVTFPIPKRAAYIKFRHPASRFALVGVCVADTDLGPRVAVTGAGASVFRLPQLESALRDNFTPHAVAALTVPADMLNTDLHATSEYRAHLTKVLARRAVERAVSDSAPHYGK